MSRKITLFLSSMLTIMSAAIIAPSLPQMKEVFSDYPLAEFTSKLVVTLPTLFIAVIAPLAGSIIDKLGRIKLLNIAVLLYALFGSSAYYLEGLYQILLSRILLGMVIGFIMTITTTLAGDYFIGEERRKFMSMQMAFVAFGGVFFVLVGGFLSAIYWRAPFLIYLAALLILPLSMLYLNEPKNRTSKIEKFRLELSFKPFYMLHIVSFFTWVIYFMIPVQLPFLLYSMGAKQELIGIGIATSTGVAAASSLFYVYVKKILSFSTIYSVFFAVMGVGYLIIALSSGNLGLFIGLVLSGISVGQIMTNSNIWLIETTPEGIRGREVGRLVTFRFFGQFFSPILVFPIVYFWGLQEAFLIVGIILVIATTFFLFVKLNYYENTKINHARENS